MRRRGDSIDNAADAATTTGEKNTDEVLRGTNIKNATTVLKKSKEAVLAHLTNQGDKDGRRRQGSYLHVSRSERDDLLWSAGGGNNAPRKALWSWRPKGDKEEQFQIQGLRPLSAAQMFPSSLSQSRA